MSNLLSIAVLNTRTKSDVGRKEFISIYTLETVLKRSQGRNLNRDDGGSCLLWLVSYDFAQSAFL